MLGVWLCYHDSRHKAIHVLASTADDATYHAALHFGVRVFDVVCRYVYSREYVGDVPGVVPPLKRAKARTAQ